MCCFYSLQFQFQFHLLDSTSLIYPIKHIANRMELVEELLKAGADPNAKNAEGVRPFDIDLEGHRLTWRRDNEDRVVADRRQQAAERGLGDMSALARAFAFG